MNILTKYLAKCHVDDYSELTEEEKQTYLEWNEILNGRKITDEDVAKFLEDELEDILRKLPNVPNDSRTDLFLKMKLEFIRKVRGFLNAPKIEKQLLEENISKLIQ